MRKRFVFVLLVGIIVLNFVTAIPYEGIFTDGGDSNGDGFVDITDGVVLLNYLFMNGKEPECLRAIDNDGNGLIDITDAVRLFGYLFQNGPAPAFGNVAPGSCNIVGDLSGQSVDLNGDGVKEEIGDHIRIDEILNFEDVSDVISTIKCEKRGNNKFFNDKPCRVPIFIIDNQNVNIYLGCASDGKLDIIEYRNYVNCKEAEDDLRVIPSNFSKNAHLFTGHGNDYLISVAASSGQTYLQGYGGNDILYGGDLSKDYLMIEGETSNNIDAHDGDDIIFGGGGRDVINGGEGRDVIFGNDGSDLINNYPGFGDFSQDIIFGGSGNDRIDGSRSEVNGDFIFGGAGKDWIKGNAGNDYIVGDSEIEFKIKEGMSFEFILDQVKLSPQYNFAFVGEGVVDESGSSRDYIEGGKGDDIILGEKGIDKINGGEGNDEINGGEGNDEINGGEGNDAIYGGDGNDEINGGEGNDVIYGGDGNDDLKGGCGDDYLEGGEGDDIIVGDDSWLEECNGNDWLIGGEGNDIISGESGSDVIYGGEGDDELHGDYRDPTNPLNVKGVNGNDYICGGDGKDKIYGDTPVWGGAGMDWLVSGPRPDGGLEIVTGLYGDSDGDIFILNGEGNVPFFKPPTDENDYSGGDLCGEGRLQIDPFDVKEQCRIVERGRWGPDSPIFLLADGIYPNIVGINFFEVIFPDCGYPLRVEDDSGTVPYSGNEQPYPAACNADTHVCCEKVDIGILYCRDKKDGCDSGNGELLTNIGRCNG